MRIKASKDELILSSANNQLTREKTGIAEL